MLRLAGNHYYLMDDKNRITLPKEFRDQLLRGRRKDVVMVLSPMMNSLRIYPMDEWETILANINEMDKSSDVDPGVVLFYRHLYMGTQVKCSIDSSGRILVSDKLQEMAGIKERNIFILGQGKYLEIWSRRQWVEHLDVMRTKVNEAFKYTARVGL